jgi:hypothetical protein
VILTAASSAAVAGSRAFSWVEPASSFGGSSSPLAPRRVLAVISVSWTT